MGEDLGRTNPFALLAKLMPGARDDMGAYTLLLAGMQFKEGPGFVLLAGKSVPGAETLSGFNLCSCASIAKCDPTGASCLLIATPEELERTDCRRSRPLCRLLFCEENPSSLELARCDVRRTGCPETVYIGGRSEVSCCSADGPRASVCGRHKKDTTMTLRQLAIGSVALLAAVAALAAISSRRPSNLRPNSVSGSAPLHAYGSRSLMQRNTAGNSKLDATLADLSSHASRANPDHWLADLHSLSPAAHFSQSAQARLLWCSSMPSRAAIRSSSKSALVGLGLEHAAVYANDVGGWLPVVQLDAAAARAEVHSHARRDVAYAYRRRRPRRVTSPSAATSCARLIRPSRGSGVTVGVLSDSFNCYAVYAADSVSGLGNCGLCARTASRPICATRHATGDLPRTSTCWRRRTRRQLRTGAA